MRVETIKHNVINPARAPACVLALLLLSNTVFADHGRDFLLVQTARIGDPGEFTVISRQDYVRGEGEDIYEFEPLLSWTAFDGLSFEINGDAEKSSGESFNYEATVPGLRLRFTRPEDAIALGLAIRYEMAAEDEEPDALKLNGLFSYEYESWLFGANVNYEKPEGDGSESGYGLAAKREIRHHLAVGLEAEGSFEEEQSGEIIIGLYWEPIHGFQFNAGIGTGFNSEEDYTVKTALVWVFGQSGHD